MCHQPLDEEGVWRDVEAEIDRCNATAYDRAVGLLVELRAVAADRDAMPAFEKRPIAIRVRHARKAQFVERLAGLGNSGG